MQLRKTTFLLIVSYIIGASRSIRVCRLGLLERSASVQCAAPLIYALLKSKMPDWGPIQAGISPGNFHAIALYFLSNISKLSLGARPSEKSVDILAGH